MNAVAGLTQATTFNAFGNVMTQRLDGRNGLGAGDVGSNPAALTNTRYAALSDATVMSDASFSGVSSVSHPLQIWLKGLGGFGEVGARDGAPGFSTSYGGGAVGADTVLSSGAVVGMALGGTSAQAQQKGSAGATTINSYQLALYGSLPMAYRLVGDGAVMGGYDTYTASRGGDVPGLAVISSSHGGASFGFNTGVSGTYAVSSLLVTPRLGMTYANVSQESFTEKGSSPLSLAVAPGTVQSLRSHLGVTVSGAQIPVLAVLAPEVHVGWRHEFMDDTARVDARFTTSTGPSFLQVSVPLGRDAAEFGTSVRLAVPSLIRGATSSLFASYDGAASSNGSEHTFQVGVRLTW